MSKLMSGFPKMLARTTIFFKCRRSAEEAKKCLIFLKRYRNTLLHISFSTFAILCPTLSLAFWRCSLYFLSVKGAFKCLVILKRCRNFLLHISSLIFAPLCPISCLAFWRCSLELLYFLSVSFFWNDVGILYCIYAP